MRFVKLLFLLLALGTLAGLLWYMLPRLPDGVSRRRVTINERKIQLLVINLSHPDWRFALLNNPSAPKDVESWRKSLDADLVFNAAYFDEDNAPSGYFAVEDAVSTVSWPAIEEQRKTASYSFLVTINDDDLVLTYLPSEPKKEPSPNSFLSFPTLIANGRPMVETNSYKTASRTMLAEDKDGNDYVIITEKGALSLYEAARWLAEQPENFVTAGNLDGGPSTGLSLENGENDLELFSVPVPSVIAGYRE